MKRVIIVGCDGQDGRILFGDLAARGCSVLGIARNSVRSNGANGRQRVDIVDAASIEALVREFQPEQVYYLVAFHQSSEDPLELNPRQLFEASSQVHVTGLVNFLQALSSHCPQARLFYAASSLVFGETPTAIQDEQTPLNPVCIYGITKAAGIHACRYYRRSQSLFASVGILYNHESPYRKPAFVSQKIVRAAVRISQGRQDKLVLGDLSSEVDWGWAADHVRAMTMIMDLPVSDDFIIATGQPHSVRDFVQEAFGQVGLDWTKFVEVNPGIMTRRRTGLIGDARKLRRLTGWEPSVSFHEMVANLVRSARECPGLDHAV